MPNHGRSSHRSCATVEGLAGDADIAAVAAAVGQPARAIMLSELLSGQSLPAGELATRARVTRGTASLHLSRLLDAGLVAVESVGRERHYRLAGEDVAAALEALQRLAPARPVQALRGVARAAQLRFARTCYDHLAGRVGVAITEAMRVRGYLSLVDGTLTVTCAGERWFGAQGIDVEDLRRQRRALVLSCQDWSERRPHIAGALGRALATHALASGWLQRAPDSRAVSVTPSGRAWLSRSLGVVVTEGTSDR